MEEFRDIPGYEGKYMVSDLGNVKSILNGERILSTYQHGNIYLTVQLCYDGDIKRHLVHRLVLSAFNGISELDCNHKNGVRDDNRLENLEWCTRSENLKHKYRELGYEGAFKGKFGKDHHSSKRLAQYSVDGELIKEWHGAYYAGRELNITPSGITAVCRGVRNKAGGFIWKYID